MDKVMQVIIMELREQRVDALQRFVDALGSSSRTFRYFESRPLEVVDDHLVTLLGTVDREPVVYGHLDLDGDRVWLGIAVVEGARGRSDAAGAAHV